MRYQLKKAWRDVTAGGTRSLLMVFALALGVWGLGSVAVAARILEHDLRQNFQGTEPPHAVVTLALAGSIDPDRLGPGVSGEYRDLAMLRIEVRPDEWIPLWLFAVGDFEDQKIAKITPQSGAIAPPTGTMVIERDGLKISMLKTGTGARVRSGGRILGVPVAGIVFDPAQAPATQDHFIYAYSNRATWASLTGQQPLSRLVLRFSHVHSKAEVELAVASLHLPEGVSVVVPPFEEHPHQWQLDLIMGIILAVGLLSFLLSSVMVGLVVSALLARQVRQIGILKALGASRRRIVAMYSLYLAVLALAAGLISVPLALVTGQWFSTFVAEILNFNILTRSVPAGTVIFLTGVAAVLPFLFAAPTLWRAGRIPVREALAAPGVAVPRFGPAKGFWAGRNLLRRPGRTLVVIGTTALGVAIFSTGFNIRESLAEFLGSTRDAMRFDLQVVLSEPVDRVKLLDPFRGILGIGRTELWTGGRGVLQSGVSNTGGMGVVALPWNTTMAVPRLLAGRWLISADKPEILVNQEAFVQLGKPRIGTEVALLLGGLKRQVVVVGLVEEIDKSKIYLSDALWTVWADPAHKANTLSIVARDRSYTGVMALKKELEQGVAASNLKVLYVISQAERTKIIADHLNIILTVLLFLSFLVLWVSALGTSAAASITVMERTREIGVLRAIGAGPRRIVRMFLAEGMVTAAVGLAFGLALSWPLSQVASSFFGTLMLGEGAVLRFAWSPTGGALTVAVTLVFGWLSSWGPARSATRISTRKALSYE